MFIKFIKSVDRILFFNILKTIHNICYTIKLRVIRIKTNYFLSKKNTFQNISFFFDNKNLISKLCEIHGSDKGYINYNSETPFGWKRHSYSNFYFNLFNHCKDAIKLVFEVGIGTNNPSLPSNMTSNGKPGASLRVWKDYFLNAQIYGADIDKNILFNNEDRISTFYVDQLNEESINKMWTEINKKDFDIIIDDGLHTDRANISFFLNSFDKLKKNGIYIIEDVSYFYLNIIVEKLKTYKPEVIILNSLDFEKPKYQNGSALGMGDNLILLRKY